MDVEAKSEVEAAGAKAQSAQAEIPSQHKYIWDYSAGEVGAAFLSGAGGFFVETGESIVDGWNNLVADTRGTLLDWEYSLLMSAASSLPSMRGTNFIDPAMEFLGADGLEQARMMGAFGAETLLFSVVPGGMAVRGAKWSGASRVAPMPIQVTSARLSNAMDPAIANLQHTSKGYLPPYDPLYRPRNITLTNDRMFVRVHGDNNQTRSWMMRLQEIEGLTPSQIQQKYALEYVPKYVSTVEVPSSTQMRVSVAGAQSSWGVSGGGFQYEALGRLPETSFKHPMPIYNPVFEPSYFTAPYPNWSRVVYR